MESKCDVAIVGAGPYGLAAAAHLRQAGVEARIFGEPMWFWARQMPRGMVLRSPWCATHIADPDRRLTLDAFARIERDKFPQKRVPVESFVDYGKWFRGRAIADHDSRTVACIERTSDGFRLRLDRGEAVYASRVVVAAGIGAFAWRPEQFRDVPRQFASHASELTEPDEFAGRRVLVIGGGQSALESAALLNEAGADVEVIVRGGRLHWRPYRFRRPGIRAIRRLLYAPSEVGPAGLSWIPEFPELFRRFPPRMQERIARRVMRPEPSDNLLPRLKGVRIGTGLPIARASVDGDSLRLTLADGCERVADHAVLATGYRIDVTQYPFLDRRLVAPVARVDGYPRLNEGFESSVRGLHFLGAPAAVSFGPLMRFIAGSGFAARALTRAVTATA